MTDGIIVFGMFAITLAGVVVPVASIAILKALRDGAKTQ